MPNMPWPSARCPICRGSLGRRLGVDARAASGLPIDVSECPKKGGYCHFDRGYTFESLGGFQKQGMIYILTSDDDRLTPSSETMWILEANVRVIVHLNFRSASHVTHTGAAHWILNEGWKKNNTLASTVSTGMPNGPYVGPVYSQPFEPGTIKLRGSNTWEGTYFVFVELVEPARLAASAPCVRSRMANWQQKQPHVRRGASPATPDPVGELSFRVLTPPTTANATTPARVSPRSLFTARDGAVLTPPMSPRTRSLADGTATEPPPSPEQSTALAPTSAWNRRRASVMRAARSILRLTKAKRRHGAHSPSAHSVVSVARGGG